MNNVFLFILNNVKNFLVSNVASFVLILSLPSIVLVLLVALIIQLVTKKPTKLKLFNGYLAVVLILYFNIFLAGGKSVRTLIATTLDYSIFLSAFVILAIIGNITLLTFKRKAKAIIKTNNLLKIDKVNETEKQVETISCIEEPVSVYSGYIDVSYVKSLIDKLKQSPLEYEDEKEIEDFEIYLLNFVNRQPSGYERKCLSEYMGSLIKKLAKYNAI